MSDTPGEVDEPQEAADEPPDDDELAEEERKPATPEEVAATATEFVSGLLEAIDLHADVSSSIEATSAFIDITGEDLGILIGRRGQTLDALQEITRTAVQRRLRSRGR